MIVLETSTDTDLTGGVLANNFGTYKYYDTPDGEDCLHKLWYVSKYAIAYGLSVSSVDALMYSHPKGYAQIAARFATISLPLVGMGAGFAASTCMATRLRKKDDPLNHFIGGLTSGLIAGAAWKSTRVSVYGGAALGLLLAFKKDCDMRGWSFFMPPEQPRVYSDFGWYNRDYSYSADPKDKQVA